MSSQAPGVVSGRMTWRLLLGDWSRLVRDPVDLLRLSFLVAAIVLFANDDMSGGLRLLETFALLVIARFLDLPRPFDLALVLAMLLQSLGYVLGLFRALPFWDELLHIYVPLVVAPLFYILLVRLDALPDLGGERGGQRHRYIGILLATVALGITAGAFYEIWEYLANRYLGTSYQIGYGDTIVDMLLDLGGSLGGGLLLLVWAEYGWGTARRVAPSGERS